jgi:predicted ATPase
MDDVPQLFRVLYGLWHFHVVRAEHQAARQLGEQCLSLVQQVHDPVLLLEVQWVVGVSSFFLGEFRRARTSWEQGIALYAPDQHSHHRELFGVDLGVFCLCFAAHTLWHLGYPDQAHTRISAALTLAQEIAHPFSLALALDYAAILCQFCGDAPMAQALAEKAITLCTEQGFAYYLAWGTIMQGWALATQGQGEEGLAQMRHGLAAIRATGAALRQPYYLAVLAEVYGQCGHAADGLTMLAEALEAVRTTGECWWEAELYRLRGELLGQQGIEPKWVEAEACFQQALEVARNQQAKALELRTAMSLSRLWQQQGRQEETRQLLTTVYGWFTEGFETADVHEAKALLEVLGA